MSLSDLSEHVALPVEPEASSAIYLLKRGLSCISQGHCAEGIAIFMLAREQLPPNRMHLATVLDTFIQDYMGYWRVQQAFHEASRRFVEAEVEQQARVTALEKLLSTLVENTASAPHAIAQTSTNQQGQQQLESLRVPTTNPTSYQASTEPQRSPEDSNALPTLYFTCFGRFEVKRLNQTIVLCSNRNGQTILRYLIAQPGHRATIDTLMAVLWPEDEPEVAQPKLHIAISALRRSLNQGYSCESGHGHILCKNRTYYLNPKVAIQTDVDEFLQCYHMGQQISEKRVVFYERACRLYTGPFLSEDVYADWSFLQREQLNQTYLAMCRELTSHYLYVKRYEDAANWATAILKENHCDETAHQYLMRVYAVQGRRSEALQQYQRCERILREELGVQPLPETTLIFQAILSNEPPSD